MRTLGASKLASLVEALDRAYTDALFNSMQDHLYFSVIARSQPDASALDLYNNVGLLQDAEAQYASNASGPLTTPIGPTYGFR